MVIGMVRRDSTYGKLIHSMTDNHEQIDLPEDQQVFAQVDTEPVTLRISCKHSIGVVGYDAEHGVLFGLHRAPRGDVLGELTLFIDALQRRNLRPTDSAIAGWRLSSSEGATPDTMLTMETRQRAGNLFVHNYMDTGALDDREKPDVLAVHYLPRDEPRYQIDLQRGTS